MLTRDQILALTKLPSKEVHVPEWNGSVRFRKFSGRDRFEFEQLMAQEGISDIALATAAVAVAAVDEEGNRLFTTDDVSAIQNLDADTIVRLGREVLVFNGIIAEGQEAAGNA